MASLNGASLLTVQVIEPEFHTILAALRYYQERGLGKATNRSARIEDLATNGGQVVALDAAAIDQLCERINTTTL